MQMRQRLAHGEGGLVQTEFTLEHDGQNVCCAARAGGARWVQPLSCRPHRVARHPAGSRVVAQVGSGTIRFDF